MPSLMLPNQKPGKLQLYKKIENREICLSVQSDTV
jgi:hypothetical protein